MFLTSGLLISLDSIQFFNATTGQLSIEISSMKDWTFDMNWSNFPSIFRDFSNWIHYQNRGGHGPASLHDEARGLVDLSGIDLRRPRIQADLLSYPAPPQVTISGVTGATSSCLSGLDSQHHGSRLMGSHPSLGSNVGGSVQPQDSLTASLQMYTRPWRSNSLTPPGCVTQQVKSQASPASKLLKELHVKQV